MKRRALTLIELLAAIVLMSLALTVLLGAAGPLAAGPRRLQAVATTRDALERARLLAERAPEPAWGEPVVELSLGASLIARDARGTLPPQRVDLPPGWSASLADDRWPRHSASGGATSGGAMSGGAMSGGAASGGVIRFWSEPVSGRGWSDDAVIELARGAASSGDGSARLELLGISGEAREVTDPDENPR